MNTTIYSRVRASLGMAAVAATLGACAGDVTDIASPITADLSSNTTGGFVRLVKFGPIGTTATFSISATGGTLPLGSTVTVNACDESNPPCPDTYFVWQATDATDVDVTITEVSFTGNLVLERINVISSKDGTYNIFSPTDPTVVVGVSDVHSATVRFKNIEGDEPPPPPDTEGIGGCTPGFWRQTQHFQYWTAPYTPGTPFGDVFTDAFPGQTLHDVVQLGGGGLNALGRHAVAALLNAASAEVDFGLSPASVIAGFNAAVASGGYEGQKNIFESLNERGCTATD